MTNIRQSTRSEPRTETVVMGTVRSHGRRASGTSSVDALVPTWFRAVSLIVILGCIGLPIAYVLAASVSSDLSIAAGKVLPTAFNIGNYVAVWQAVSLARGLANSLIISGSTAVLSAALGFVAAYVLVRFVFRGRVAYLRSLLVIQSVPGTLLVLPIFVVFSSASTLLGIPLIGSRFGLVLTYLTFALPFSTWILVTYIGGLPLALEEAARVDGASNLRILRSVVLPMSWPGIVVAAIFAFLQGWNDVVYASVLTNKDSVTAAIIVQNFGATQSGGPLPQYSLLMTATVITAVPVIILYLVFQRFLVGGLTAGAVK